MHGLYGWHWLHGLHKDKRDVLRRKVITSTKPSVIASVGVQKPRLKTPRRVEAAGLPRHHIHVDIIAETTEPEVRDDAGYQTNKNAWVSPLSTSGPPTSMVQYEPKKSLQHARGPPWPPTHCDCGSPNRSANRARTSVTYWRPSSRGMRCSKSLSVGSLIQPSMGMALSSR